MPGASTSLHCRTALLADGWAGDVRLQLQDGRIAAIETDVPWRMGDETLQVAVPGLANVHSHAFQRAMAGLAERRGPGADSFWTWRQVMYRFLDRMGPEDVRDVAAQAYVEMLEGGFTRVGEFHYLHHAPDGRPYRQIGEMCWRVAEAAEQAGIGLTLLPCFYAHGGIGGQPAEAGQRRFLNDLDSFARLMDSATAAMAALPQGGLGIAPHSLRAVTRPELSALLAGWPGLPVHVHVAEQQAEVAACLEATGQRPVAWLLDHAPVDGRWCLIHATHVTEAERDAMAARGAVVGLCPLTEASLGDGVMQADAFMAAGGRFGIGTDSNIAIDACAELRQLEYGQRLRLQARNVMAGGADISTGRALWQAALAGGGQALGCAAGLAVGALADVVALDTAHPSLAGRRGDDVLDGAVFACARSCVDSVWRAGVRVVQQGRHVRGEAITARYRACLARLLA